MHKRRWKAKLGLSEGDKLRVHDRARQALREAVRTRYPVVLVIGRGPELEPELWQEFAEGEGLGFVDILRELRGEECRRAADCWPTFVDWIRQRAIALGGAVVVDLDAVATKWEEDGRERLFGRLLKSQTGRADRQGPAPIVAVSSLAGDLCLPGDQSEHGLVLHLRE